MKQTALILCLLILQACANSATRDIEVDTEAYPGVDYSVYKTYAWLGSAAIVQDPEGQWEPPQLDADAEIRFLIDGEMRARGLTESQSNADMLVFYGAGIDMTKSEVRFDPDSELEKMTSVPKGALKVVLIDNKSKTAIWVGVAVGEIQHNPDQDITRKRLEHAVRSMFKSLPR